MLWELPTYEAEHGRPTVPIAVFRRRTWHRTRGSPRVRDSSRLPRCRQKVPAGLHHPDELGPGSGPGGQGRIRRSAVSRWSARARTPSCRSASSCSCVRNTGCRRHARTAVEREARPAGRRRGRVSARGRDSWICPLQRVSLYGHWPRWICNSLWGDRPAFSRRF